MNKARLGTILTADDDPDSRAVLARRLRRRGYEVVEAEDGRSALARIAEHPIQLVLLDSLMPDMTGIDVLSALRADARTATLPAIMVTGKAFQEDMDKALECGANGYVTKPVDFAIALALIESLMTRKD